MSKSVRQPTPATPAQEQPSPEHERCVPELSPEDSQTLGDLFDAISDKYGQILSERQRASQELEGDAQVNDPPPAWQSIALTVGAIALSAATAGVGGVVAASLAGSVAGAASKAAAKGIESAMKSAVDKSLQAGLSAAYDGVSSLAQTNPVAAFFRGQGDAISNSNAQAQDTFTQTGRDGLRCAEDPISAAEALFNALEAGRQIAKQEQRAATLDSYCRLLSQSQLGVRGEGTATEGTNLHEQLGDTSAKGVLGLQVRTGQSHRSRVSIDYAEMEGLNESLRNEIAARPLNSLRLAITVHGEVDPPSFLEELSGHRRYARGRLKFGENESGTAFNHSDRGGNQWLASKGDPVDAYITAPGTYVPQPNESEQEAFRWSAIRSILHDELGPMSLQQLGVTLGG